MSSELIVMIILHLDTNMESLHCTPETNVMFCQSYLIFKKRNAQTTIGIPIPLGKPLYSQGYEYPI